MEKAPVKIIWIKAGGLVPTDVGANIRSYQILRQLALTNQVTLFTFYPAHPDDAHPQLDQIFHRVICQPLPIPTGRGFANAWGFVSQFLSSQPYSIAKYTYAEVARNLRQLLQTERFDVLVCDFIFAAGVVPWDLPLPKVLFTHNVEAMIWQRHYEVAENPLWKLVSWREWKRICRAERRYLEQADHVLTVSETDRAFFSRMVPSECISAVPTGVDVDYFRPGSAAERPHSLVFTGAMDWPANEDAVLYFVSEILPDIRRQVPEVVLTVVGRRPSAKIRALASARNGIEVTGRVEDIRPFLQQASLVVVPLRVGSGTRLKIFEAMASGKTVVSTSVGAEGLPVTNGENIILADEPEDFARHTVELLRDAGRRKALGAAARRLVQENYSWTAVAAEFNTILARVTGSAAHSSKIPLHPSPASPR